MTFSAPQEFNANDAVKKTINEFTSTLYGKRIEVLNGAFAGKIMRVRFTTTYPGSLDYSVAGDIENPDDKINGNREFRIRADIKVRVLEELNQT